MKFQTEESEVEIPLASAGPELVEQMKDLRKNIVESLAGGDREFVGVVRNSEGEWVGIFRKKS